MCKELYFISSKCYTNFITTEPFKITIFLYNTGCLKLVSIACLGLEVAELKEEDMPMVFFTIFNRH